MDKEIEQLLQSLNIAVPSEAPVQPNIPRRMIYVWSIGCAVALSCVMLVWALWPSPKRISRCIEQPERCVSRAVCASSRHMWRANELPYRTKSPVSLCFQYETALSLKERIQALSGYQKEFADLMAEQIVHPDQSRAHVLRHMLDQFLVADLVSANHIVHSLEQLSPQEQDREIACQGLGHHIVEYKHQYALITQVKADIARARQAMESVDSIVALADLVREVRHAENSEILPFLDRKELEKIPEAVVRAIDRISQNLHEQPFLRRCSQEERKAIETLISFDPDSVLWEQIDGSRKPYSRPISLVFREKMFGSAPFATSCVRLLYVPESCLR